MATYIFKYNPSGTPEDGATQIKTLQYSTGGVVGIFSSLHSTNISYTIVHVSPF
jgi:hypothetical protein